MPGMKINGRFIEAERIEKEELELRDYYQAKLTEAEYIKLEPKLAEFTREKIIAAALMEDAASEDTEPVSKEECTAEFEKMKLHFGGSGEFYKRFGKGPDDDPEIKERIILSLKVDRLVNKLSGSAVFPDDEQIERRYAEKPQRWMRPESVIASHILITTEESEALKIRREITSGLSFQAAAEKYSQCPSSKDGGDLGVIHRGETEVEFEDYCFNAAIDEISQPVKTIHGLHLILVREKLQAGNRSLSEVKTTIAAEIMSEKRAEKVHAFLRDLRAEAEIILLD